MTVDQSAQELVSAHRSLVLATVSRYGDPTASHAPFVRLNGYLYVYTSAMSRHTGDMKQCPKASAMIIQSECATANVFAPRRITFSCVAQAVARSNDEYREVLDLFSQTFGKIFEPMKTLGDFTLFRLDPLEIKYVEGFGRAYLLSKNLHLQEHITGPKS